MRATFGKKPINRNANVEIQDKYQTIYTGRNELLTRLMADVCEICGNTEKVEGHHIRKLADLNKRDKGKQEIPIWARKMMAIRRKPLFVCRECHEKIHNGIYDGVKLTNIQPESRIR